MDQNLKNELSEKMTKAMDMLDREFSGLRTGRASVHLLDPVIVEVYGSKMPISQVGTVSTPDAKTITVQVWDKAMVKTVEKAIADANLGVNPSSDGQLIRMNLPPLSEERRKELVKIAHKNMGGKIQKSLFVMCAGMEWISLSKWKKVMKFPKMSTIHIPMKYKN